MISFFRRKRKIQENTITEEVYENNLQFYTILKILIQCGFSDVQLAVFQNVLVEMRQKANKEEIIQVLLSNPKIVKEETQRYQDICNLINTFECCDSEMWLDLVELSVDLMRVKKIILDESKMHAQNQIEVMEHAEDKLSIEYDMSGLNIPYGQRVISSLLVNAMTDVNNEKDILLQNSKKMLKLSNNKISKLINKYNINCNNIFLIIMIESVNQSITSDAGQKYESRVASTLEPMVGILGSHTHDSKIPSVEYDFTFELNNKKFGISAKRTLRERYKQNFEDVDSLDVDYMFVFTLGTDLSPEKVNNILQKRGQYIVISSEVYESNLYLKNNMRVFSSKELSRELFMRISTTEILTEEKLKEIKEEVI